MLKAASSVNVYRDISQIGFFSRVILKFLSRLYRIVVSIRNTAYDRRWLKSRRLPGKTISVGNLVVGGTGKSPFVIALAQDFLARGFKPAIITRGHGSQLAKDESMVLLNGEIQVPPERTRKSTPDEAMMQSRELRDVPVVIGARRTAAVDRFFKHSTTMAQQITHWILDDGFQHRQICRDLDLVLLDSSLPYGNGYLLPLGTLREPIKNVSRGHFVVFTRSDDKVPVKSIVKEIKGCGVEHVSFAPQRVDAPILVQGKSLKPVTDPALSVAIVSAIARPERFVRSLELFGITVNERYFLPDHWTFDEDRLRRLGAENDVIVTTAKDYWRDTTVFANLAVPVYVLPIHFNIDKNTLAQIAEILEDVSC